MGPSLKSTQLQGETQRLCREKGEKERTERARKEQEAKRWEQLKNIQLKADVGSAIFLGGALLL
jgi:hypothetical protein